jgi:hypothetical protein
MCDYLVSAKLAGASKRAGQPWMWSVRQLLFR